MDAGKVIIDEVFTSNRLLEVPFYQRTYVWEEEQWARFKDDMEYISETQKPYFLGSIILKQMPTTTSNDRSRSRITDRRVIIDGQQRLTTIMLFFKAFYLLADQNDDFKSDFCLKGGEPQLAHGKADTEAFSFVMSIEDTEEAKTKEWKGGKSNIIDAFHYFLENINMERTDDISVLQNVTLIAIDINQDEDEQQIFDTINSLGVTLTTAELLKNFFFNRDNVQDFEEYWESIFESDSETREWWSSEIVTGRIKRTVIDLFFDSFLQILVQAPQYSVSTEDKIAYARVDQLFHSYQEFLDRYFYKKHSGDAGKIEFLVLMSEYAEIFKEVFDPEIASRAIDKDDSLQRLNIVMFGLKNSTLMPYVLYLARNVDDKQELSEMLRILESYIMRRMVTRESTKNYNRLFSSLILKRILTRDDLVKELNSSDDTTTRTPDDDEVEKAFANEHRLTNLQTKGILYLIEASIRPKNCGTDILTFNSYSLEHLMPKKWSNNWGALATDEEKRARDRALLTLGNLAIITQSLNASIRDADWDTKRNGKGNKDGLIACSKGLSTFEGVLEEDNWNEDAITARAAKLASSANRIWRL